jgi:hypothetical protein
MIAGNLSHQIEILSKTITFITPLICNIAIKENNLWTNTQVESTSERNNSYRKDFLKSLGYTPKKRKQFPCMVTGQSGDGEEVVAAHLAPAKSKARILDSIGMTEQDINSPRNFLLLSKNIEKAFDKLQLSFVKENPLSNNLVMKIWDNSIRSKKIWEGSDHVIGSYDGAILRLGHHIPFKRAMSYQAYQAYLVHKHLHFNEPIDFGTEEAREFARERKLMKQDVIKAINDEVEAYNEIDIEDDLEDL